MDFARPEFAKSMYPHLMNLIPKRHEVIMEMEDKARECRFPMIGPLVGRLVMQQARLIGAKRIFEMGSGFGYSAAWFTQLPDAHVTCTDGDPENAKMAEAYLGRLGVWDRVDFHVGKAQDVLKEQEGLFDIIFCDIDKQDYPEALELAIPRVRSGGLIIFDNVCWSGYAWEQLPEDAPGYMQVMTPGVRAVNEMMFSRDDLFPTIVPLRDGVALISKL